MSIKKKEPGEKNSWNFLKVKKTRLGKIFLLFFLIVSLSPIIIFMSLGYIQQKKDILEKDQAQLLRISYERHKSLEAYFNRIRDNLNHQSDLNQNVNILQDLKNNFKDSGKTLRKFVKSHPYTELREEKCNDLKKLQINYAYQDVYLIDQRGNILYSAQNGQDLGTNVFEQDTKFAQACVMALESGDFFYSDILRYSFADNGLVHFFVRALEDENGKKIGVMAVRLGIEGLNSLISNFRIGATVESYLLGEDLAMRSESRFLGKDVILKKKVMNVNSQAFANDVLAVNSLNEENHVFFNPYLDYRDVSVVGVHRHVQIGGQVFAIIVEKDAEEIFAPIQRLKKIFFLIILLTSIIVWVISFLLSSWLVAPILRLTDWTKEVASGNFSVKEIKAPKNEIGDMALSFKTMITSLLSARADLDKTTVSRDELIREVEARAKTQEKLRAIARELYEKNDQLSQATAQLVHTEKFTALGELTSGIAHELNQPLNIVKIICQTFLKDIQKNRFDVEELKGDLPEIVKQMDRMATIIEHMRAFVKQEDGSISESVNVTSIIRNMFDFVAQQLRSHNIDLIEDLAEDLPSIRGNSNSLERVFFNIMTNARHAVKVSEKSEKAISVRTYLSEDKKEVIVEIKDTGDGIPEEETSKIFQPFFTKKQALAPDGKPMQGSGLGLSTAYGIIKNHKGRIEVDGNLGQGAIFKIFLPV